MAKPAETGFSNADLLSGIPKGGNRQKIMSITNVKCLRIARTCSLYLSYFALGLCVAVPGPTLLDLQHVINTDTQHIALIYSSRSVGYLVGSFIGGVAFDMVTRKQPLLIAGNLLMAVSTLVTPWCRSLVTLIVAMAVSGFSMGAIDTGSNVYCLNLWGKDSGPFFQALHFTFGLGGLVAPLIAAPFLSSMESLENDDTRLSSNETFELSNSRNINYIWENSSSDDSPGIPPVTYAYTIMGGYTFIVTLFFVALYILAPEANSAKKEEAKDDKDQGRQFKYGVVFVTGLLLAVCVGAEIGFAQMLTTCVVKGNLKLSKTTGSYMTSAFWGSFTFGRGISIFLAIRFTSLTLMVYDIVLTMTASIILLALGTTYESCLWLGTIILGLGIASFFPSTIAWIDRYINVTSTITAFLVFWCALGEMAIPLTISIFIDTVPEVLFYVVLTSSLLCCVFTTLVFIILSRRVEKYVSEQNIPPLDNTMNLEKF